MNAPTGLEVLSQAECTAKLASGCVGRVGLIVDGAPHVLPVNYAADATGEVVYRTAGDSLLATVAGQSVVFEVDGFDEKAKTRLERLRPRRSARGARARGPQPRRSSPSVPS